MGGYRSGRSRFRLLCEEARGIDARRWQREGYLHAGRYFSWGWWNNYGEKTGSIGVRIGEETVTLNYTVDGEPYEPTVRLSRTPCHFGGERVWFFCPRCYKRCAKLYLRWSVFRCRRCQCMGYLVENQNLGQRLWMKAEKIERRLGPNLSRPKGMRKHTHKRLRERYWAIEERRDRWFDQEVIRRWEHAGGGGAQGADLFFSVRAVGGGRQAAGQAG
jgi:hypothetical protein